MARIAGLFLLLSLSTCGQARLAPDYSARLVAKLSDLREAVLQFTQDERGQYATDQGRFPANKAIYDGWLTQAQGMTEDSRRLDDVIDCVPLADRMRDLVQSAGGIGPLLKKADDGPTDMRGRYTTMLGEMKKRGCQTQMFFDLQERIIHMAEEHDLDDRELAQNRKLASLRSTLRKARNDRQREKASDSIAQFYADQAAAKWGPPTQAMIFHAGNYPLMAGGVLGGIAAIEPVLQAKHP